MWIRASGSELAAAETYDLHFDHRHAEQTACPCWQQEVLSKQRAHALAQYLRHHLQIVAPIEEMAYLGNDPAFKAKGANAEWNSNKRRMQTAAIRILIPTYRPPAWTAKELVSGPFQPVPGKDHPNERMVECACGINPALIVSGHL